MGRVNNWQSQLSDRALILALQPDASPFRDWTDVHRAAIDWPWLLRRATAHKLAALLAARVEECGLLPILDAAVAAGFREVRRDAQARAGSAQSTLKRLADVFSTAEIPFFVIKGSVLAEHVYGDVSWRRFVDVDLVTRRAMLARAETALRSLGYQFGQVEELLGSIPQGTAETQVAEMLTRRFYERFQYELPFDVPRGRDLLPVDLHWHVFAPGRSTVRADELWEQTVTLEVAGMRISTFSPAATILHLSVHAGTCALAGFRLLHFCDVAWAAQRWSDETDAVWTLAEKWGLRAHLRDVCEAVERALQIRLPLMSRRDIRSAGSLRGVMRQRLTASFLLQAGRDSQWSVAQRVWGEWVWNVAMRCLAWNVGRSLRTRWIRLQWIALRRRIRTDA